MRDTDLVVAEARIATFERELDPELDVRTFALRDYYRRMLAELKQRRREDRVLVIVTAGQLLATSAYAGDNAIREAIEQARTLVALVDAQDNGEDIESDVISGEIG